MDSIEKKLYGDYPYPFQTQEYKHGYGVAPRQGADNIALLMQGWHGLQQQAPQPPGARGPQGATAYRGPPPPQQHYGATTSAAYGAAYAQGPPPAAGAPTNYAYDVYGYGGPQPSTRSPRGAPPGAGQPPYGSEAPSPLPQHGPAAGSYTPQVPGEVRRGHWLRTQGTTTAWPSHWLRVWPSARCLPHRFLGRAAGCLPSRGCTTTCARTSPAGPSRPPTPARRTAPAAPAGARRAAWRQWRATRTRCRPS